MVKEIDTKVLNTEKRGKEEIYQPLVLQQHKFSHEPDIVTIPLQLLLGEFLYNYCLSLSQRQEPNAENPDFSERILRSCSTVTSWWIGNQLV